MGPRGPSPPLVTDAAGSRTIPFRTVSRYRLVMRIGFAFLVVSVMLSGCIDRPNRQRPRLVASAVVGTDPAALRQCIGRLDHMVARYQLLPDRNFGGQCDALGAVKLLDIGTPVANLGAMTCRLGEAFTRWVQNDLQASAQKFLSSRVVKVESMGTYACRNVNGAASGKLSEHAHANAVDVSAFMLADGRRLSVQDWWFTDGEAAQFLRAVRAAGCNRFSTVLSPDYNAAHHDHLHFDLGGKPFCR